MTTPAKRPQTTQMFMKKVAILAVMAGLIGLVAQAADSVNNRTNGDSTLATTPKSSYSSDQGHAGRFGAGATFGEPIGADVKYWFNETMAIDGAMGYSFHDNTILYLHSDVLWHDFHLFPVSQGQLPLYFGVGTLARFRNDGNANEVGIRAPVGISYILENAPVDIFMEVAPTLDIAPGVRGEVTGGIGIRYWF
jgi:opacity protein-like surface antigen